MSTQPEDDVGISRSQETTFEPIAVDGSALEGGGQILRNAMAYSALLQKPIKVSQIRANRTPPGLRPQHATGLQLVSQLSERSTLMGVSTGSNEVTFLPGQTLIGYHEADTKTAGSIALLIQVALPCLLFAHCEGESELVLKGGTNATMAPQVDYTLHVLLPFLKTHLGIDLGLTIVKRGFYPKGGGEVHLRVPALKLPLPAFEITSRGEVVAIRGLVVVTAAVPQRALGEIAAAARRYLKEAGYDSRRVDIEEVRERPERGPGHGSAVLLWAETEGGCKLSGGSLSARGTTNDGVAKEAVEELLEHIATGAPVDEWMQDQMIIFMALAKGKSKVLTPKLSLHTETAIMIAEQLTDARFSVTDESEGRVMIECQGVGLAPNGSTDQQVSTSVP